MAAEEEAKEPPPLPPRPQMEYASAASHYPYTSPYSASPYTASPFTGSGYSTSPFSVSPFASSPYSGFGPPHYGQGPPGLANRDWTLSRLAEERTRGAWESLDSVVQAVSSVSLLLENTSAALHNSFRAVVGVADHFGRLRRLFASLFLSVNLLRFLRWLLSRLERLIGLRRSGAELGHAWAGALPIGDGDDASAEGGPKWSSLLFLAVSLGAPWLLYKAGAYLARSAAEEERWREGRGPHYTAKALHDFHATQEGELPLRKGQSILVAPKHLQPRLRGWLLAAPSPASAAEMPNSSASGESQAQAKPGLVPINYVSITGRHPTPSNPNVRDTL